MAEIDRFRPDDRRQVEALYRRVFGPDAADASRLRWDWQYRRNPNAPAEGPLIWVAREAATIVGHYATMPVRLAIKGQEFDAAWGTDVMVAPERRRQGVGDARFVRGIVRSARRSAWASRIHRTSCCESCAGRPSGRFAAW